MKNSYGEKINNYTFASFSSLGLIFLGSACRRRLEKSKLDGDVTSIGVNANYKAKGQLALDSMEYARLQRCFHSASIQRLKEISFHQL